MLAEQGVQLESIGGDVVGVPISALKVRDTSPFLQSSRIDLERQHR